jgi:hypothetical protein
MQTEQTAQRVAHNQATFRDANERIEQAALDVAGDAPMIPFICECPRVTCSELARLSLVEYETVRSRGVWFLVVPGHEVCEVDGVEVAQVVRKHERFSMMEKVGEAGEVAEATDPRSDD